MKTEFAKIGWIWTDSDYVVFTQCDESGMAILGAHVNDVMLAVLKPSLVRQKEDLLGTFDMHYMGDLHWYTGIKIMHDRTQHTITISQDLYTCNILEHFNMSKAQPTATPMISKLRLEKLDSPAVNLKLYQSMLGSVMYVMIGTWPDLAFAIGYLSHHAATPGDEHLSALKSVYQYLVKSKDASLTFDGSKPMVLHGYMDSDLSGRHCRRGHKQKEERD
jgi:Reverse transcriptase (RNA-dependent DNA polymerase)